MMHRLKSEGPLRRGMEWTCSGDDILLRLDPGEELHATLHAVAEALDLNAAAVTSGIGRVRQSVYGYMDDDHVYHRRTIEGGAELVALQGNLVRHEQGHPFTHLHVVLSDDDLRPAAGHLFEATVHVTAELHLRRLTSAVAMRCPLEHSQFTALYLGNEVEGEPSKTVEAGLEP